MDELILQKELLKVVWLNNRIGIIITSNASEILEIMENSLANYMSTITSLGALLNNIEQLSIWEISLILEKIRSFSYPIWQMLNEYTPLWEKYKRSGSQIFSAQTLWELLMEYSSKLGYIMREKIRNRFAELGIQLTTINYERTEYNPWAIYLEFKNWRKSGITLDEFHTVYDELSKYFDIHSKRDNFDELHLFWKKLTNS